MKVKAVILLFLFLFSIAPGRISLVGADFGESSTSLGHFIDDFVDLDNVSATYQVINNESLDCMELSFGSVVDTWLQGWDYRKSLIIGNSTGAGTDYQVKLIVHFGTGLDSRDEVFCENSSQPDFDDIRWTDNDGTTLLDYWLEEKTDSDNATNWVEIADDLSNESVTIFMYYGNSSVSTLSNMTNTFPTFSDDFLGGSLDTGKWDTYNTPVIVVSGGEINITSISALVRGIRAKTSLGSGYAVRTRSRIMTGNYAWYCGFSKYSPTADWMIIFSDPSGDLHSQTRRATGTETDYQSGTKDTNYNVFEVRWISASLVQYLINDGSYYNCTVSGSIPDTDQPSGNFAAYDGSMKADWIVVRKVVDPEPIPISWGEREIQLGFQSNGYFITSDYLDQVNGSSLVQMTNSTIPEGTAITVSFSDDNSTWINETVITEGFLSIDLRTLNWGSAYYLNYSFSTENISRTPRLYQSRLVTTEGEIGPGLNVTGIWTYYNASSVDTSVGTLDSGNLASLHVVDGDSYNVSEVVGTPGMMISVNFTGIDDDTESLWFICYHLYDGNQVHKFDKEMWNFTGSSWVEIGQFGDGTVFVFHNETVWDMRIPSDFLNNGEVRVRFDHEAAGNINHNLYLDYVNIIGHVPSSVTPIAAEPFQFFWIVIAIALMIVGIVLARMWPDDGDP